MPHENKDARRRYSDIIYAASWVDRKRLALEPELVITRWPDYAFMSPLEATQHFADRYLDAMRSFRKRDLDRKLAENVLPVDLRHPATDAKMFTQFWAARQKADRLGVRYDDYIRFSFEFASRRARRKGGGRRHMPQPNQLGPAESNPRSSAAWHEHWQEYWQERYREYLVRPKRQPQFSVDAFCGLPAQRAFRERVLDQAKTGRRDYARLLFEICVDRRCLPIRALAPVMGRQRFLAQVGRLRDLREYRDFVRSGEGTPIGVVDLWQSCMGHPGARDEASPVCAICLIRRSAHS